MAMDKKLKERLQNIEEVYSDAEKLLEINTWFNWFHTDFTFVKAGLNKDFEWSLQLKLWKIPTKANSGYTVTLILNTMHYNQRLWHLYNELKSKQLSLVRWDMDVLEDMQKIHSEYRIKLKEATRFSFSASWSSINRDNNNITFDVDNEVVTAFEKLHRTEKLEDMILVLESE